MTTYLRPGVFTEETLLPIKDTVVERGNAVAAFVGTTSKGGPVGPTLVTSWSQYQALFGSVRTTRDAIAYATYSYFNNGGSAAYIVRAVNDNATAASLTITDGATLDEADVITLTAKSPGTWASDTSTGIFVTLTPLANDRFNLVIEIGTGNAVSARETFLDLSLAPTDVRNAEAIVNSPTIGSKFVRLDVDDATLVPEATIQELLIGGSEGTGTPDLVAATQRLDDVDGNILLNLPGVTSNSVLSDVLNWAEASGRVFVVVDCPAPQPGDTAADVEADATAQVGALPATSYAAVYAPWVYQADPASAVPGALVLTGPGGAVMGQYARTDAVRSVGKAPAGIATNLRGVIQPVVKFNTTSLDALNTAGVNVIRSIPGSGICIMGARTLALGSTAKYINVRRTIMFVKRVLSSASRYAIFEPNNVGLWQSLTDTISRELFQMWQAGLLNGTTPEEAFYVKCDAENNEPADVLAGRVNVDVGIALASPAEFIVIRISQFEGGAEATENPES